MDAVLSARVSHGLPLLQTTTAMLWKLKRCPLFTLYTNFTSIRRHVKPIPLPNVTNILFPLLVTMLRNPFSFPYLWKIKIHQKTFHHISEDGIKSSQSP